MNFLFPLPAFICDGGIASRAERRIKHPEYGASRFGVFMCSEFLSVGCVGQFGLLQASISPI